MRGGGQGERRGQRRGLAGVGLAQPSKLQGACENQCCCIAVCYTVGVLRDTQALAQCCLRTDIAVACFLAYPVLNPVSQAPSALTVSMLLSKELPPAPPSQGTAQPAVPATDRRKQQKRRCVGLSEGMGVCFCQRSTSLLHVCREEGNASYATWPGLGREQQGRRTRQGAKEEGLFHWFFGGSSLSQTTSNGMPLTLQSAQSCLQGIESLNASLSFPLHSLRFTWWLKPLPLSHPFTPLHSLSLIWWLHPLPHSHALSRPLTPFSLTWWLNSCPVLGSLSRPRQATRELSCGPCKDLPPSTCWASLSVRDIRWLRCLWKVRDSCRIQ